MSTDIPVQETEGSHEYVPSIERVSRSLQSLEDELTTRRANAERYSGEAALTENGKIHDLEGRIAALRIAAPADASKYPEGSLSERLARRKAA